MRTEQEISKIIQETFFSLYLSLAADNNSSPDLQTTEIHKNLLRTKIHCYLDTLCGDDLEFYSLKYQELCQLAYKELPIQVKKALKVKATELGYSDPSAVINS